MDNLMKIHNNNNNNNNYYNSNSIETRRVPRTGRRITEKQTESLKKCKT